MRATVGDIQTSMRNIETQLRDLGILRDSNELTVLRLSANRTVRLTWSTHTLGLELSKFTDSTIEEYLTFLSGRHYNFMLMDGSLIQLSYDVFRSNQVIGSRAVWFPCPVTFTAEDLEIVTIEELVLTTPQINLSCRAPLRIDFSPRQVTPDHPSTHLHSGVEKFRLPMQRAIEPSRFVRLILRTAYPELWRGKGESMVCDDWGARDSLTDEDRQTGYLGWNSITAA
jgi:hypothetical protein